MSEEIRTTSSTGGEKGVKAERYDLIPREALDALGRVYAFGAEKYADHNWRKGYEWSKSYAALMRHLTAFWSGETHDPESGLPHLAHAAFHIFALLTWLEEQGEGGEFDDRYRPKYIAHQASPEEIKETAAERQMRPGDIFILPEGVVEHGQFGLSNADLEPLLAALHDIGRQISAMLEVGNRKIDIQHLGVIENNGFAEGVADRIVREARARGRYKRDHSSARAKS